LRVVRRRLRLAPDVESHELRCGAPVRLPPDEVHGWMWRPQPAKQPPCRSSTLLVSRVSAANKQRGKGLEYHGWRPRGGVESQSPPRLEPVAALDPCCLVYRARSRRKRRSRSSVTAVRAAGTRCQRCGACRRRDEGRNQRERGWVIFGSVQINGDRTTEQGTRQGREGGKAEGGRSPERGARERETRRGKNIIWCLLIFDFSEENTTHA